MGTDRCVRPLLPRAPASELRLAPHPSETANPFAGVPAASPTRAQNPAIFAQEPLPPALPRSLQRRPHLAGDDVVARVEVPLKREAAPRPAESARDRDTGSSRCQSAPSCLQTE